MLGKMPAEVLANIASFCSLQPEAAAEQGAATAPAPASASAPPPAQSSAAASAASAAPSHASSQHADPRSLLALAQVSRKMRDAVKQDGKLELRQKDEVAHKHLLDSKFGMKYGNIAKHLIARGHDPRSAWLTIGAVEGYCGNEPIAPIVVNAWKKYGGNPIDEKAYGNVGKANMYLMDPDVAETNQLRATAALLDSVADFPDWAPNYRYFFADRPAKRYAELTDEVLATYAEGTYVVFRAMQSAAIEKQKDPYSDRNSRIIFHGGMKSTLLFNPAQSEVVSVPGAMYFVEKRDIEKSGKKVKNIIALRHVPKNSAAYDAIIRDPEKYTLMGRR